MMGAHVVEELCFEVEFASEDEAFEAQERLARFAQVRGQRVIGDVFDEVVLGDAVFRVERLEVDVGTVAVVDFEERFAERLREELRRVLGERTAGMGVEPSVGGERYAGLDSAVEMGACAGLEASTGIGRATSVELTLGTGAYAGVESSAEVGQAMGEAPSLGIGACVGVEAAEGIGRDDSLTTVARAELEWLLHFIEYGFLPWHAPGDIGRDVQGLAVRVLERNGVELARGLRGVPASRWRGMFRRLVAQFPAEWLGELGREIGGRARTRAQISAVLSEPLDSDFGSVASARVEADTWRRVLRDDAAWLKETLERLGRGVRGRRRLAAVLPWEIVADVLGLWLSAVQVDVVLATMGVGGGAFIDEVGNTGVPRGVVRAGGLFAVLTYILVEGGGTEFSEVGYRRCLGNQGVRGGDEALECEGGLAREAPGHQLSTDVEKNETAAAASDSVACGAGRFEILAEFDPVARDAAHFRANSDWVEEATVSSREPNGSEGPGSTNTAAMDDPYEALAPSRARTLVEAVLGQSTESPGNPTKQSVRGKDEALERERIAIGLNLGTRLSEVREKKQTTVTEVRGAGAVTATDTVNVSVYQGAHPDSQLLLHVAGSSDASAERSASARSDTVPTAAATPGSAAREAGISRSRARAWVEVILRESLESDAALGTSAPMAADIWRSVLRDDAVWLKAILLQLGRGIRARRRLAAVLPDVVVADVLGLWLSPGQVDTVLATIGGPTTPFTDVLASAESPREAISVRGLFAALTYLLVGGGAWEFSEAGYRRSLRDQAVRGGKEALEREGIAAGSTAGGAAQLAGRSGSPVASESEKAGQSHQLPDSVGALSGLEVLSPRAGGGRGDSERDGGASAPALRGPGLEGLASYGAASHRTALHGTASYGAAPCEPESHGTAPHGTELHATAPHGTASRGAAPCEPGSHGTAPHGTASRGAAPHGPELHATAPHGTASRGAAPREPGSHATAPHGTASLGAAPREPGSHGTAPHGTASHATAPHGTGSHGTASRGAASRESESHGTGSHGTGSHGTESREPGSHGTRSHGTGSPGTASREPGSHGTRAYGPTWHEAQSHEAVSTDRRPVTLAGLGDLGDGGALADLGVGQVPGGVELLSHLRGRLTPKSATDDLRRAMMALLDQRSASGRRVLLSVLEYPGAGRRLAALLAVGDLAEVLQWLCPGDGATVLAVAARVAGVSLNAAGRHIGRGQTEAGDLPSVGVDGTGRGNDDNAVNSGKHGDHQNTGNAANIDDDVLTRVVGEFLFTELFEEGRTFDPEPFAQRLTAAVGGTVASTVGGAAGSTVGGAAGSTVGDAVTGALGATLAPRTKSGAAVPKREQSDYFARVSARGAADPGRAQTATPIEPPLAMDDGAVTQRIYVANAGVVIVGPYLPRLFGMLGLTNKESFISLDATHRAVHLIQYIVTGVTVTPEPMLVLNKILCGLPISAPIPLDIDLRAQEQAAIEEMLAAVIAHWKAIGRTSISGLRESFLQREGRLISADEAWRLRVESKCFDMLLDRLPWGYAMVKYPWMKRVLHVDWR